MHKFLIATVLIALSKLLTASVPETDKNGYTYQEISDSIKYWNDKSTAFNENFNLIAHSDNALLKTATLLKSNGIYNKANNQLQIIIKNKNADPLIKAFAYWQLSKICMDSSDYGNFEVQYLKMDSIFNSILTPNELLLYYHELVLDKRATTLQTIPKQLLEKGLKIAKNNSNWSMHAQYLHKLTEHYRNSGDYYNALKFHNQSLEECKNYNLENLERAYLLWSYEIYEYTGDTLRILRDINRALMLNVQYNDSLLIAESYNNLGRYFTLIKNYPAAIENYKNAASINHRIQNTYSLAINYLNLGEAFLFLQNYNQAARYYQKAIRLNNQVGFYIGNGYAYAGMITIQWKNNKPDDAMAYIDSAKIYAQLSKYHRVNKFLYQTLIDFYYQNNQKDSCIAYQFKLAAIVDSVDSHDIHARMQMYETNLKEHEIALLTSEQNALKIKHQKFNQQIVWLGITILIFLVALLVIMALYFNKEKAYSLLVEKNMELIRIHETSTKPCSEKTQETNSKDSLLAESFLQVLRKESYYRNSNITLDDFADLLKTNRAYLSKAINNTFNKNFSVIINEYRIQEACKMLINAHYNYLSIEGIASTVGFSSKTNFNRIFKQQTGLTPSNFRENQTDLVTQENMINQ